MKLTKYTVLVALVATLGVGVETASAATTAQQLKTYRKIEQRHAGTLAFFDRRAWMAAPSHGKCWQIRKGLVVAPKKNVRWVVPAVDRRKTCRNAREALANAEARLANVRRMIEKLTVVAGPVGNTTAWNCIYHEERHPTQGWATRTGNGYYGGLQMDLAFQRAHGLDLLLKKGTANNWSSYEQMVVAQRAHDGVRTYWDSGKSRVGFYREGGRGYNPWPNTARECGLLLH